MIDIILIVGGILLGLAIVVIALLIWQATVRPYTYEDLFQLPAEGAIMMANAEGVSRIITMEGTTNFRDLGGYETTGGQRVRWGTIYRSARLLQLTDADVERMAKLGIRTVVDFRQSEEVDEFPNRLPDATDYRRIPVFEDTPMAPRRVIFNRHRLLDVFAGVYVNHIVERGGGAYGQLLQLLADPDRLPLLFHCTAGKDRTGVASVLILMLLGVPRETAVNDYLLTNLSAEAFIDNVNTQLGARNVRGVAVEQLYPLVAASPRLINAALDHIATKYGDVEGYLRQKAGLTDELYGRLCQNLLVQG